MALTAADMKVGGLNEYILGSTTYTIKPRHSLEQGCGVGVGAGVGVARSRGNEPGVGVGVDQTASTPTPERFVCICLYRGEFASTFWK